MMTIRRQIKALLLMALLVGPCAGLGGCIRFYSYHPTHVTVRDAETGTPIAGAEIQVWYLYVMVLNPPDPASAVTNQQGVADVRVATFLHEWNISSDGYLTESTYGPDSVDGTEPDQGFNFRLYRRPAPRITIVVPNGYRGALKIETRPVAQWVQESAGKREFVFRASATGYVSIDATPLLLRDRAPNLSVVFEDGRPIPEADWRVAPSDVALRDVESAGERDLYMIGTEQDVEAIRRLIYDGDPRQRRRNERAFNALFEERR
jgi:hypothetical protein